MAPLKITHCFTALRSLGGVESVLRHHYANDARFGLDSRFVIYFEAAGEPLERVDFLDFSARLSIRQMRRRAAAAFSKRPSQVVIYHGMWGMRTLAGPDLSDRRLLILHGTTPGMNTPLRACGPWVDGILGVSQPLLRLVEQCVPRLAKERLAWLPYPVTAPAALPVVAPAPPPRRLVLGVCGRLTCEQKRIDRLPQLFARLNAAGLDYRAEFLGDGAERPWLEGQLPDRHKFLFHGRKSGDDYWRILRGWDVILSVSDYEGTPIAVLEALSQGVIPIYPRIDSGGESYAEEVGPGLVYAPEDFDQVLRTLEELRQLPESEFERLRQRGRAAVERHLGDAYMQTFGDFVRKMAAEPAVAPRQVPARSFPIDRLPYAWLTTVEEMLLRFKKRQTPNAKR
jgi:glycosyltransferase involved in cell wall biosynthesis